MLDFRWRAWLWVCVLVATVAKLIFAFRTTGTNDLMFYQYSWRKSLESGGGIGLYQDGVSHVDVFGRPYFHEHFRNPPFVIHFLRTCGFFATRFGLSFPFCLRLPSILADMAIVILLGKLLKPKRPREWLALLAVALSPVSVLISGFHGSTDSLVLAFTLLAVLLLLQPGRSLWAGLAFGMSLNVKVWPAIFLPAIIVWLPDWNSRLRFLLSAAAIFLLASMPFLAQDPILVTGRLFGYPSVYAQWGTSRLLSWAAAAWDLAGISKFFETYGRFFALGLLAWLGWWMQQERKPAALPLRIAILTGLFLCITPGFGVQYLCWFTPWLALVGPEAVLAYSFIGSVFLFAVYHHWSLGRWILADSYQQGPWFGTAILYELFCWVTVLITSWCLWRLASPSEIRLPAAATTAPSKRRQKRKT
ncbi:MAG: glycosyltransferase 87 family protein [Bryobacteraceae bacterium]|nr:glycosyltransferase 87 family protein [Bryobacteraceae bacterium]MDW8379759.1 glycosyltransferase 87 family protein [Bryobacterales bacterium]